MKQQVEVGKFNVLGKRIIKAYFDPVNVCLNVDNLEHYLSMNDKITEIQKRMSGNKHGKIGNAVQQKPSSQSSAVQLSEDKPKVKVPTYIKIVQVKGLSINVARESGTICFFKCANAFTTGTLNMAKATKNISIDTHVTGIELYAVIEKVLPGGQTVVQQSPIIEPWSFSLFVEQFNSVERMSGFSKGVRASCVSPKILI